MKKYQLKEIIQEVMQEVMQQESQASDDAKRQGLDYFGFGRYGKDGKITHKSSGGKLAPVKATGTTPSASNRTASSAPQRAVPDRVKSAYKNSRNTGDEGLEGATILAKLFGTPAEQRQLKAAEEHRRQMPYRGTTAKSRKYVQLAQGLIKKYEPQLGLTPDAPKDKNALTAKNVNPKADIAGAKKQITTRYQSALRANNIDIIDDSVPGMLLLGTPGGGGSTDFTAVGQQADGQWTIRPVSHIDKKDNPVFHDNDDAFTVAPTLDAAMQSYYGTKPSKQSEKPANDNNYRRR